MKVNKRSEIKDKRMKDKDEFTDTSARYARYAVQNDETTVCTRN